MINAAGSDHLRLPSHLDTPDLGQPYSKSRPPNNREAAGL